MEGCLFIGLLLLVLATVEYPVIPGVLFIWHLTVLVRVHEKKGGVPILIWVVVFLGLSFVPFLLEAKGRQGHGSITGMPYSVTAGDIEMQRFLIGQVVLNLLGAVGWTVALRAGKSLEEAKETERSSSP